MVTGGESAAASVDRAFGAANRARLLAEYLDAAGPLTPANAWEHCYRLLLWIDRTIGLAHCYESDKCQPGRPWYARSLSFHGWLAAKLGTTPADLAGEIDVLFSRAVEELARAVQSRSEARVAAANAQRQPYAGQGYPLPGEDPELVAIVVEALGPALIGSPFDETWRALAERVRAYVQAENKRKNLLGEGFEDTLAAIIRRLPAANGWEVRNRALLSELPGFNPQGSAEKQKRVDLALWKPGTDRRVLVTSKWSVRADREEQFGTDFDTYVRVNTGPPFDYVWITNEFDAARLKNACERLSGNAQLFTDVVHLNTEAVLTTHGTGGRRAAAALPGLVETDRLQSLEQWLSKTFR